MTGCECCDVGLQEGADAQALGGGWGWNGGEGEGALIAKWGYLHRGCCYTTNLHLSPPSSSSCCLLCAQAGGKDAAAAAPVVPREPSKPVVYPNKEAAKEAFKQLLLVRLTLTLTFCSVDFKT